MISSWTIFCILVGYGGESIFKSLIFIVLIATTAQAEVDPRTGHFKEQWFDISINNTGYQLYLKRTYNSNFKNVGLFGRSWCTPFEDRIQFKSNQTIEFTPCSQAEKILFLNTKGKSSDLQKIWGEKFYGAQRSNDYIQITRVGFKRFLSDGSFQYFNSDGLLTGYASPRGERLTITRNSSHQITAITSHSDQLRISYKNNLVHKIVANVGLPLIYTYKKSNLIKVRNAWGDTIKYSYTRNHLLEAITHPDGKTTKLNYDKRSQKVLSIVSGNDCKETLKYRQQNSRSNFSEVLVRKVCQNKLIAKKAFKIWHWPKNKKYSSNKVKKISIASGSSVLSIHYHQQFNKPVMIKEGKVVRKFNYNKSGLLIKSTSNRSIKKYRYLPNTNLVANYTEKYRVNKKWQVKRVAYKYNKLGMMIFAKHASGPQLKIKYDRRGRVIGLKLNQKKWVNLNYMGNKNIANKISQGKKNLLKIKLGKNSSILKATKYGPQRNSVQIVSALDAYIKILKPLHNPQEVL